MEVRVGDAIRMVDEGLADAIPKGINDSLREANMPLCIGKMQERKSFSLNEMDALPEASDLVLALTAYLVDRADEIGFHLAQIILCTRCVLFDRCKVLSGLTR